MALGANRLLKLYRDMLLIREVEDAVMESAKRGLVPGFVHVGTGQEACQAGMMDCLTTKDYKLFDHRCHGAACLTGTDPNKVMAEIFGRVDGINQGLGGAGHISDWRNGNVGHNGIVGSTVVTALGTAYYAKRKNNSAVTLVFVGDGMMGEGTMHESMTMAATWKLPIIYGLVNNQYAIATHYQAVHPWKEMHTWAEGYGVPHCRVDGNDIEAVVEAMEQAVERARRGEGPSFIEFLTYRWQPHFSGDPAADRPKDEEAYWKGRDPLVLAKKILVEREHIAEEKLTEIETSVNEQVKEMVEFGEKSPFPKPEDAFKYVYADREIEVMPNE